VGRPSPIMRPMPTVLLVRHGQASFGTDDYDVLSEVGHQQAEIAAASLAERGYRPTRLICGTLRRQRETAAAFTALGGPELEIEPRWDEFDSEDILRHHGDPAISLEGRADGVQLTNRAFQAAIEAAQTQWAEHADRSPTTQTWPQFSASAPAALRDLSTELASGETAIVVTSGGAIAALLCHLWDAPATLFPALNRITINASVTKLAVGSTGTNVISFNDHSHLESVDRALVTYR
jgi:broad specificity phosphatase PhoE